MNYVFQLIILLFCLSTPATQLYTASLFLMLSVFNPPYSHKGLNLMEEKEKRKKRKKREEEEEN